MGALARALSEARAAGGAFSAWLERAAGGGGNRGSGGGEAGMDIDGDDPLGLSSNTVYSYAKKRAAAAAAANGGELARAPPASLGEFEAERDAFAALTSALQRAAGGGL